MKIEIQSTHVDEFSGVSQRTNKAFTIRKQQAWAHLEGEPYPRAITIPLFKDQQPYQPGEYTLAGKSFFVNKFGELDMRPNLKKAG